MRIFLHFISFVWGLGAVHAAQSSDSAILVAADGSGRFKTVAEAVAACPDNSTSPVVIHIKPGVYQGPVIVPKSKPHLVFRGADSGKTILTYALNVNDPIPAGSDKFNPGVQIQADDFRAENITFENTSGDHGQALALRVDGDRCAFFKCRMLGWQDTLMVNNGRHYFENCHIEGRVDFIYGSATAWFQRCTIHSKNGGYVTAASTPEDHPFGYVFSECDLTGDPAPWIGPDGKPMKPSRGKPVTALGRPWRPAASVTWLTCRMGAHILPAGWDNWRKPENEKTARYAEYKSHGPGANPDKRVSWSRQLTDAEAARITLAAVLGGNDGWRPDVVR